MIPTAVFLLLFPTFIIFLYLHLTRNYNYWKHRNVDYIKPTLLFGNFYKVVTFQTFVGDFLRDLYESTTKPIMGFFCFDQPYLLVRDPEIIKRILVKDFDHFSDRSVEESKTADRIGSGMLFNVKNPQWKMLRNKLTPSFTTNKIKNMTVLIVEVADNMVEYVSNRVSKEGTTLPTREVIMKYTTDVIVSCAFGMSANSFVNEDAEFRVISRLVFINTYTRAISALSYFFSPLLVSVARLKWMDPTVTAFMKRIFDESMENRKKNRIHRGDLVDILLNLKETNEREGIDLDDSLLAAQAFAFFVAGFETTGSTIFFTLYELAYNQNIQKNLRDDINLILDKHEQLSYETVQKMTYLDMVVSETLRKYPVLPFVNRRCTKDFNVPNTETVIQKGLSVYIPLLGLHYDPQYFPNPEKYDPERFSSENKSKIPNFVYMPFGEGLHNCIGERFGLINVKIGLAAVIRNYQIDPCKDTVYPITLNTKAFLMTPENNEVPLNFTKISGLK